MKSSVFIKTHRPTWRELEQHIQINSKRLRSKDKSDILQFIAVFKKVSSHLAYAKTYYPNDEIVPYLNRIVSEAHHLIYKEQVRSVDQLTSFFKYYFPTLIRRRSSFIGLAFLLFMIGGFSGYISVFNDPMNLYLLLPAEITESIDPHRVGEGHDQISHPLMSAEIFTNNIQVAFLAFIGGITFGLFTGYLLLFNGLLLGALTALFVQAGESYIFWAYILPHGIIELIVIFVAGGSGLYMGYRMLIPGMFSRWIQIRKAAKESVQLLLGTLPLFVIAGIIEGYITPSALSLEMKYLFAGLTLLAVIAYFIYGYAHKDEAERMEAS
jgi:uncharacterized membrane protein SpoIIM required for sporulation